MDAVSYINQNKDVLRKDFWRIVLSASYIEKKDYKNAGLIVSEVSEQSEMYIQAKRLSFSIAILELQSLNRGEIDRLFKRLKADKQLYESRPLTAFFFNTVSIYNKSCIFKHLFIWCKNRIL